MNDEKNNANLPEEELKRKEVSQPDAPEVSETVVLGDTDGEKMEDSSQSITSDISQSRKEKVESFRVDIKDETLPEEPAPEAVEEESEQCVDFSSVDQEEAGHTRKIDLPEDLKSVDKAASKSSKPDPKKKKVFTPGVGCLRSAIYAACVVVVSILLAGFILMGANDMLGLVKSDKEVDVTIPVGATTDDVAKILKDHGVISQPFFFKLYSNLVKDDEGYEAGTFTVNTQWGYDQIVARLKTNEEESEIVRITFPEGYTLKQIASKLEEEGVCSARSFMDQINEGKFDTSLVDQIEPNEDRYTLLEGYLFPDTYDFYIGESAHNVISKFLNNLENKFTDKMRDQCAEIGMTPDEVLTLASIVQKEAGDVEEMKNVASVFLNRLQPGSPYPRLESDPTMKYESDKYNTYDINGLPPGPICNPGLDAISAVLYPADTDYYFFVTDEDGNYYYAKTYEQHLENCRKAGISLE